MKARSDELLRDAEQLPLPELRDFVGRVVAVWARRNAPSLSKDESRLLRRINRGLPSPTQKRLDELVAKRQAETLTEREHRELLSLVEQTEKMNVERIKCLAELAALRGVTLPVVMDQLGIQPPPYV